MAVLLGALSCGGSTGDDDSDGGMDAGGTADADGDGISDADEGRASNTNTDGDGMPDYLDPDSDNDCRPDSVEAGDADVNTGPVDTDNDGKPDYQDLDSDDDGLSDEDEDENCNGTVDAGESSALQDDTDDDGASDLIESAIGTDPNDDEDNPEANGDFVFLMPYQGSPSPAQQDLAFETKLRKVDVYPLVDRSGSMSEELGAIRSNLQTALNNLTCPPAGTGSPEDCIEDLWSGAGSIGYTGASGFPYVNHLDIQPNNALPGPALPSTEPLGCCSEPIHLALWSTFTGNGTSGSGCSPTATYSARGSCSGSAAGANAFGYPCFREDSLRVVLLVTDETPSQDYDCPGASTVVNEATSIGARIVGVMGSSPEAGVESELQLLATQTGAVDANNSDAPLVFAGDDANAATAIENAVRSLVTSAPLDSMAASLSDDPSDAVEATVAFVDYLETLQVDSAACTDGHIDQDTDADGNPDTYRFVVPGTPLCWRLFTKMNTTVTATTEAQAFKATIEILGEGSTGLDERDVFFVVPPTPID